MNSSLARAFSVGLLAVAILAVAQPVARADYVTVDFLSVDPGNSLKYKLNGTAHTTSAGRFNWNLLDGSNVVPFKTFCIDLTHFVPGGGYVSNSYHLDPAGSYYVSGSPVLANLQKWFNRYFPAVGFSGFTTNDQAAEFQLGIWEIITDTGNVNGLNLSNGSFKTNYSTNPGWVNATQTMLNNINDPASNSFNLFVMWSDTHQDQITVDRNHGGGGPNPPNPIPAPPTVILAGLGALGFGGFAWRRRRLSVI